MTTRLTLGALLAAIATPALAVDWQPSAELGAVHTSGNSDTLSVNGKFALKSADDPTWVNDHYALFLLGRQDGEDTAKRYEVGSKLGYRFNERWHTFGSLRYENDEFSPFEYQAVLAVGLGYQAIKNDTTSLLFEVGPGIRRAESAVTGATSSDGIVRGFGDFKHQFNEHVAFFNTLLVEASSDNTFAQNDIGISVAMTDTLALKAALQARHNTDVDPGIDKTDTLTTLNLVWAPKD
jgi:putative salt-induced outer membrane protein